MTSHKKMITYFWNFSFDFFTIHNIWSLFDLYISFWDQCLKFLIFQFDEQSFGFLGIIYFQYKSLFLFPSQILVCAMAFAAHYLFSFWDLYLLSFISKNNKKCGKIYRHKSMQVSKPSRLLTNHSWHAWRSIYNNYT